MTAIGVITNYIWYALYELESVSKPHMQDPSDGEIFIKEGRKTFKITIEEIK